MQQSATAELREYAFSRHNSVFSRSTVLTNLYAGFVHITAVVVQRGLWFRKPSVVGSNSMAGSMRHFGDN
jgi:hypothetical protein